MINGFGAEIFVCPAEAGEPSKAGEAVEWRIDGALVFTREKPVGIWADHKPVMRAATLILTGWTFDEYFLSCLGNPFMILLNAGAGLSHKASGKLSRDSIHILSQGRRDAISFPDCAIQAATP